MVQPIEIKRLYFLLSIATDAYKCARADVGDFLRTALASTQTEHAVPFLLVEKWLFRQRVKLW